MSDHVYRTLELTGSSEVSVEDAVRTAIRRANAKRRSFLSIAVTR